MIKYNNKHRVQKNILCLLQDKSNSREWKRKVRNIGLVVIIVTTIHGGRNIFKVALRHGVDWHEADEEEE